MKKFLKNKWHLHLLTTPMGVLFLHLAQKGFLALDDVGVVFQAFLTIFISVAVAFCVEWYQGIKGYNRTSEQLKQSNLDILVSAVGGVLSIILFFCFKSFYAEIFYSLLAIILILEGVRRYEKSRF